MNEITRLVAIEAIKQLRARYIRYLDTKDWDNFEKVFCSDATADYQAQQDPVSGRSLQETLGDGENWRLTGSTAIARAVRDGVGTKATVHHVYSPEIEILSPSTARGIWALEDIIKSSSGVDEQGASQGFRGYGHYHETYENASGQWRIKTLRVTRLMLEFL